MAINITGFRQHLLISHNHMYDKCHMDHSPIVPDLGVISLFVFQIADELFGANPWKVPWTAKNILQVKNFYILQGD